MPSTPRPSLAPRIRPWNAARSRSARTGLGFAVAALGLLPAAVQAAPVWTGDFERGDLSQFGFVLNGEFAAAQGREVAEGNWAGRIELHNEAAWGNGLKRVELQHRPEDARTAEGATTFFAWSVMAPEILSLEPSQQIGYWESNNTFQQMMAFAVAGEGIRFSTRRPDNVVQWDDAGAFTTGDWHRIAMQVLWSTDPQIGLVNVWFDGVQVVTDASAQTLADNNPHFVQFGLLRGAIEFDDVPTVFVDYALEGDSLQDVDYDALPGRSGGETSGGEVDESSGGAAETTGGPAGTTGGADPTEANTTGGGAADSGPEPEAVTGSVETATTGQTDTDASGADADGGGCSLAERPEPASAFGAVFLLALFGTGRRKRICPSTGA